MAKEDHHAEKFHYHYPKDGLAIRCYHKCRNRWLPWLCVAAFWIASTEPVEQHLWAEVPPFKQIAEFVHLPVVAHND